MKKTITLLCMAAALAWMLLAPGAGAQNGFNVSIFPAKVEFSADPGATSEFEVSVHNLGAEDQTLRVYFNDYFIRANNEFVFREPGYYSYSCASWLSTDSPELFAPAGQVVTKRFTAAVPPGAEPGGHYGVIFFEQGPPAGQPVVGARPRLGALVLLTVPGEIIRKAEMKSVTVTSSWLWPTRGIPLLPRKVVKCRVVFHNSGNVHLTIRGGITYTPTFGWGSGSIKLGEITVLPGTTRYLETEIEKPPFLGSYEVKAFVEYGPSLDVYDTRIEAKGSFSEYPLSLLFVLLAVLAAVIVLVYFLGRRKKKKAAVVEGVVSAEEEAADEETGEAEEGTQVKEPEEGKAEAEAPVADEEVATDLVEEKGEPGEKKDDDRFNARLRRALHELRGKRK